jgi:nickel transport system substrate-binding protein
VHGRFGNQQFDIPLTNIQWTDGRAPNLTIAPASQTGLFKGVGDMNPHMYRPNEFFANNWVYEGLVSYGTNGQILPALATNWTIVNGTNNTGQVITFTLRRNVTFHDGAPWNATAAKLNFDQITHTSLSGFHDWFELPTVITGYEAVGEYTFVLRLSRPYYPALQELAYIRPFRMLSPLQMPTGATATPCIVEFTCCTPVQL